MIFSISMSSSVTCFSFPRDVLGFWGLLYFWMTNKDKPAMIMIEHTIAHMISPPDSDGFLKGFNELILP